MRIIGGKYKGRVFHPNKKFSARPTTDLAKEALFNILENRYDLSAMRILDLFSGTGSIGYEFISRGVQEVTFVEKNPLHIRFIREVTGQLNMINVRIIHDDVFRFLKFSREKFDIVFADPPYDLPFIHEIPTSVFNTNVLDENSLLILEHPGNIQFSQSSHFNELRRYGKVHFSFFKKDN